MYSLLVLASFAGIQAPEEALFDSFRKALGTGVVSQITPFFARTSDSAYLFESGGQRGLRNFKAHMIPAPPGHDRDGAYWMIVSTQQDIEDHHDIVYPVIRTGDGLKLGKEIAEWEPDPYRIRHVSINAEIHPTTSVLEASSAIQLIGGAKGVAPVLRLGLQYKLKSASINGVERRTIMASDEDFERPRAGDVVKAGGVMIAWITDTAKVISIVYEGTVRSESEDKIASNAAFITAWWVPSIGRLPFTTDTTITGPDDWTIVSEGEPERVDPNIGAGKKTVRFKCDIPISFPKIIAGKYKLAAEIVEDGRAWRSYQLDPIDQDRAEADVKRIQAGIKWYEQNLGKYPFSSYSCFDADTYYGIESYSYTLLRRNVTTRFVTHELGHTYFGGIVPCAYTKDTWNESLTQYVDSVLFQNNADKTLEAGLRTTKAKMALSDMSRPGLFGSASYYRGSYVMRMLENEIGRDNVLKALRDLVATRRGVETTWLNIRPNFERASGKDLKQFWDDWVSNAEFPTIAVTDVRTVMIEGKPRSWVTIRQSGAKILNLKFKVVLKRFTDKRFEKEVALNGNQVTIPIDAGFEPNEATIDVFGMTLAEVGPVWLLKKT